MRTLHLINKSPFDSEALDTCLRLAPAGSAVLLYENGVYAAQRDTAVTEKILAAMQSLRFFALQEDCAARGLLDLVIADVTLVNYLGFVELTVDYDKVLSWL